MRTFIALLIVATILPWFPPAERMIAGEAQVGEEESVESKETDESEKKISSRFNLAVKTAGGTQLWTDHINRGGYRIQQNVLTTHWRLLDANDVRQAWGTRAHCESILDEMSPAPQTADKPKHVVVLLHGLMRTHHSMKPLEANLAEEGFSNVIRFSYASSRSSIGDHASALREVLENLPADTEVSFIGHSMGNIVVRRLIGDLERANDPKAILPRCRSMVMLGPPNQGAAIARRLAATGVYEWITGKGGMELGPEWAAFVQQLATPEFPFAIIAGDLSKNSVTIPNPLVDGSSDFVVSVDEAKLDGAESFETVPVLHSFLMNDESARKITVEFIKSH